MIRATQGTATSHPDESLVQALDELIGCSLTAGKELEDVHLSWFALSEPCSVKTNLYRTRCLIPEGAIQGLTRDFQRSCLAYSYPVLAVPGVTAMH